MKETTKNGRATGLGLIFITIILIAITISSNSLNLTLGVIISFFGLAGALCIWKPDSIGPIVSEFLDRMSKQETTESHSQTQKGTHGSAQAIATRGGKVVQIITPPTSEKEQKTKLDKINLDILDFLNEEFNKNAHKFIGSEALMKTTDLTIDKLTPHIKYLEGKGYIKTKWFLGGNFICQIASDGIDALN